MMVLVHKLEKETPGLPSASLSIISEQPPSLDL